MYRTYIIVNGISEMYIACVVLQATRINGYIVKSGRTIYTFATSHPDGNDQAQMVKIAI